MTSQNIILNLIPKGISPRLYVSQYDKGQEWNLDIYAGTEAYTIPSGSTVTIQGTKPDKTGFQYACSFSGNRVTATEQQQMTIIAGEVPAEIRIEKNNEIIATLNFIIAVEKAALADDTVISETDLPLIEEAIEVLGHADELVQRIEGDVTTSGNNALKAEGFAVGQQNGSDVASGSPYYHNNAKYYKEQAANSASTASNKASDASGSASAASGSASSASTNALKAEGFAVGQQNGSDVASGSPYYHNSAKYYKEQAADSASTASTKAGEAAASAQAAAQSAAHLTIDSAMSTSSENALQNKVISTTIQNLSNHNNVNGAKNLLPLNPPLGIYYGITVAKSSNYWTADGTASASPTAFSLLSPVFDTIPNCKVAIENTGIDMSKTYRFSRQTKVSGLRYIFRLYNGSTLLLESTLNDSNNLYLDIDMSQYPTATHIAMGLEITNGTVLSLSAIKPMLSLVSDYVLDSSWTPWAENNYALTKDKVSWADEAQLGAANLADNVLTSQTITDGNNSATLTIVVNEDKSVTLNGTAYANQYLVLDYDISRLIGKPIKVHETDVFNENAYTYVTYNYGGSTHYKSAQNGVFIIPSGVTSVRFYLVIYKNITFTNYTLYPMVTIPSYNGPYVPYAKTNKELTKDVTPEYFDLSVRSSRVSIVAQKNCKIGKQVYLWCRFTPIVSGSALAALTVPSGYRPPNVGTDSGVIIGMIAKNTTADSTKARHAQVFATGEVDVINVAQDGDYMIYGSYFID